MKMNNWKNYAFCLLVALVAGLTSGCFESQREKEVEKTSSAFKVSAADICKAFDSDETSADKRYKGKVIEVYGPVQETWAEGERTMVILSGGKGKEVRCLVSAQSEPDLADLEVGRPTMVKGKCLGIVRGDIKLGGCLVVDPLRELKVRAKSGKPQALFNLAKSLTEKKQPIQDSRRAFHLFCKAAEANHVESKDVIMASLAGGWSPETNAPVIWQWIREEAEDGNAEACYLLGMLYNVDEDFGIDPEASVPWFKKASDKGHQEAMFTMAMINYDGVLVPTNKSESVRLLSMVDANIVPRAAEVLGIMNLYGDGVPEDIPRALSLLESAAMNGRAHSANMLGAIYQRDGFVSRDAKKSLDWFLMSAEMGDAYGQAKAGLMLRYSSKENSEKRSQELIFAALSNDQQVAYSAILPYATDMVEGGRGFYGSSLITNGWVGARRINGTVIQGKYVGLGDGVLKLEKGTNIVAVPLSEFDVAGRNSYDPDFRQLLTRSLIMEEVISLVQGFTPPEPIESTNDWSKEIRIMAEEGNPDAQAFLGLDLLAVSDTRAEGLEWLKKSAEGGSSYGQNFLGMVYLKGIGLPVDKEASFRMYSQAAEQGDSESMFISGRMLLAGEGCKKDVKEGIRLIKQSADAGENDAILFLGRYYYGGRGRSRDAAQAFAWFRLGAVLGMPECQYWLGRMYYEGKGLPTDYNRAIQWLTESARRGYKPAADLLDSDAYRKEEMARAKEAYQQELERHSKRLEQIRRNPKYDVVNWAAKVPRRFSRNPQEREAYQRFSREFLQGTPMPLAAARARGRRRTSSSGNTMVVRANTSDPRALEAIQEAMLYGMPLPSGAEVVDSSSLPNGGGGDGRSRGSPFRGGQGFDVWEGGQSRGLSGGMKSMVEGSIAPFMNRWNSQGGQ